MGIIDQTLDSLQGPEEGFTQGSFIQPAIKGYRQLTQAEADLMNEVKQMAEQVGTLVEKLQRYSHIAAYSPQGREDLRKGDPTIVLLDQRWVSEGKTDLQKGFMSLVRSIANPTSF